MVAAGAPGQKKGLKDLRNGALLQMAEAATLGLPLEVWKTRMGRFRNEGTLTAFRNVYGNGGGGMSGVRAFWAGFSPKMVESATKGAVLMVAKEGIKDGLAKADIDPFLGAIIAGGGGGVAQTIVISPMVSARCSRVVISRVEAVRYSALAASVTSGRRSLTFDFRYCAAFCALTSVLLRRTWLLRR